jgi:hypothetical protein
MTLEAVSFGALLLVAFLVLVVGLVPRGADKLAGAVLLPVWGVVFGLLLMYSPPSGGEEQVTHRPSQVLEDDYVSSDVCRSCHPSNYATWHDSYHRSMTRVAGPGTVRADFEDVMLRLGAFAYRLDRRGERFVVDIEPPPGGHMAYPHARERQVVLVTGSHHYQVYWMDTGHGRELEQLPFAWLIADRRWVPRVAALLMPPQRFEGIRPGGWNRACIRCHTTHGRPRLGADGEPDTRVVEFGIACEACHGPASEHVRRHRDPRQRYVAWLQEGPDPTIVNPAELSPKRSTEVCAQCHGILEMRTDDLLEEWNARGYRYRPGDDLGATRYPVQYSRYLDSLELGEEGAAVSAEQFFLKRYWPDGMLRVVGREYNGLLDTPCFTRGPMSCLSCHLMHRRDDDPRPIGAWADDQLKPGMRSSPACVQCHGEYGSRDRIESHTHHRAESSGSHCYNCHMPYTTYGLLKAVRSHTVDSPDARTTLETGRPNACNQCHLDRSLGWTAERLEAWYGMPAPELGAEERSVAASVQWLLRGDAGQRALAAWTAGWEEAQAASGTGWIAPHLARLLNDPYDAVRYIAARSLRTLPGFAQFDYDFVGPETERAAAVRRAIERWRALGGRRGPREAPEAPADPGAVLLRVDGSLDDGAARELLARRDDRVVWLTE